MAIALFFAVWLVSGQVQAQISVTATGGTMGPTPYVTLKDAFDAVNLGTHQGAITIGVVGNTAETVSAVLNASGSGGASYTSVGISPSGGASRTITGAIAGHLIDLNGADNVTIDGLNTGGNSLIVENTSTGASSTIRFIGDASNNTVANCSLLGSASTASNGVVFFSTGATTGNDDNNINNCNITAAGANLPINGIFSLGTASPADNSGNIVNANNISDYFNAGAATNGIHVSTGNTGWAITNNRLFQTATRIYTTANTHNGINVSAGDGYTVSGNTIGYANAGGTGTYAMAGTIATRFIAIALAVGTTTTTSVQGNTFTAYTLATSSGVTTLNGIICGINITGGNVNVGTVSGNTIGGATGADLIVGTATTNGGLVVGVNSSSTGTISIQNNTIGGLTSSGVTAAVAGSITGVIVSGVATSMNISNNTIGNTTADNMRGGTLGLTTGNALVSGINMPSTPLNAIVDNNTITNLSSFGTGTSGFVRGIWTSLSGSATATGWSISGNNIQNLTTNSALAGVGSGACSALGIHHLSSQGCVISQNTISNISNINTVATTQVVVAGIMSANATVTTALGVDINRNKIWNLSNSTIGTTITAPPMVVGIGVRSGNNVTSIHNNMISIGTGLATNTTFVGIWNNNGSTPNPTSTNIYYNSVVIDGASAAGALPSFGYLRGQLNTTVNTVTVDLKNNIFDNRRTGGTGQHYAIANNFGSAVSTTGWPANASNYNLLNASNAAAIGYWTTDQTFTTWKTASSGDGNSFSGIAVSYVDLTSANLHLNMGVTPTSIESGGVAIVGITTDFDGQARPGPAGSVNGGAIVPDLGADEFDGVPLDNAPPVITYTPATNVCVPGAKTITATIVDLLSGVPTAGVGLPVLYWSINAPVGPFTAVTAVSLGSDQYQFTFGGSAVLGDLVYYYIVAQDGATPPNVGASPAFGAGGYTANPPAAGTAPTPPASYGIQPSFTGTYTVGGAGNYPTLTAAVDYYSNTPCMTGPVVFELIDAAYPSETYPIVINQNPNASATNTLTIRPASGVSPTLQGAPSTNGAIIKIFGNYVTVDGSNNGTTSRDLTISNTSATGPSVVLIGSLGTTPVMNVTVKNCIIINGVNTSTAVIVSDGNTPGTAGYFNNITIQNNNIQRAYMGVYNIAVVEPGNGSGLNIIGNDLNTAGANAIRYVGLYVQGIDGATLTGNRITNFDPTAGEIDRGIWFASGTVNSTIAQNTISTLGYTGTGAFGPTGINITTGVSNSNINVNSNVITSLSSLGTTQSSSGITVAGATSGVTIQRNSISDIKNTNTTGYGANGINLSSTSTTADVNVLNNFIWDVAANGFVGATINDNGYGIVVNTGAGYNIHYNSIHMNTDQAANGLPAAINITAGVTTAGAVNMQNNIFANSQTLGTERYAIYSAAPNTVYAAIDHNDYYTTGPNLGFLGSNRANLSAWQTATGQDANSISQNPAFISSSDLHINAAGTPVESGGTPIVGVTTDFDGDARNGTTPDIGADEGNFILTDLVGPGIAYTDIPNSICTDALSLSVQINDPSLVNTTAGTKPRLWFKKSTESNVLAATNTSASNGWKYVEASNAATPFIFNINYALLTSAVGSGDVIEYFVVAQDLAGTPNIGTNTATYNSPPTNVGLGAGAFPVSGTKTYTILVAPVTIVSQISPATLCVSGDVTLSLAGDPSTGATYQWQSSPAGANTWTNIPGATTVPYVVTGVTSDTDYRAVISCGGGPIAASPSAVATVDVSSPTVLTTTPGSECGPGPVSVALGATASVGATLNWYAAATGGAPLASGTSFNTPAISSTTTYYVAASEGGSTESAAKPTYAATPNTTGVQWGLVFDVVNAAIVIQSVDVYSVGAGGSLTVELRDNTGALITTAGPFAYPAGTVTTPVAVTIPVSISVPVGTGHRLVMGSMGGNLIRETSGSAYPYVSTSGNVSITSGYIAGTTLATYYWFYNWQVTTGCESARTPVVATIQTPTTYYQDSDMDTYGNAAVSVMDCTAPIGYVSDNTDCNDAVAAINPGATEVCNTVDDDCDLMVDEGVTSTFYADTDMDTYGDLNTTAQACTAPVGFVANSTDCNDGNAAINPGAAEICDNIDNDCSGAAEAATTTWTGAGNGSTWDDAANWSDGIVPLSCQNVVIPTGANVTVPAGFEGKGLTLDIAVGATLTMPLTALLTIMP